jgi:hypothetical protein
MEIHLKINDVVGMDDEKRHIIRVDTEEIRRMLKERKLWEQLLDDNDIRNTIYMQEKARREEKAERRERHRQCEIEKQRRRDQFIASKNYRQSVDYIHNVLGWNNEEGIQKAEG